MCTTVPAMPSTGSSWCDMDGSVRTRHELQRPWILLELVGGRFELVQFGRKADDMHDEFVAALRVALTEALTRHAAEVLAGFRADYLPPPGRDPDRDEVMAFVRRKLADVADVVPVPRKWFPERADGRDPAGAVHVSVVRSDVVTLEVPLGMLWDAQRCGWAIRDALNQALDRHDADVAEFLRRSGGQHPGAAPTEPDWAELARQARRLRGGY